MVLLAPCWAAAVRGQGITTIFIIFFPSTADQFEEADGVVRLEDISGAILEKVCQYFYYRLRYEHSESDVPDFPIEPEMALELLMASNFLDC